MWTIIRSIEKITRFFGFVGAWIVVVLICAMVYEVLSRYLFRSPTFWAYEIGYMLMGASFMFGIAFALQMRRHIRVDFLYDSLSPKKQALIDIIGYLFFLLPMVVWTTWGLWGYFYDAYKVGEVSGESAWNPIIWPFRFTFVVGFALLAIQTVAEILKCILIFKGEEIPEPEEVETRI